MSQPLSLLLLLPADAVFGGALGRKPTPEEEEDDDEEEEEEEVQRRDDPFHTFPHVLAEKDRQNTCWEVEGDGTVVSPRAPKEGALYAAASRECKPWKQTSMRKTPYITTETNSIYLPEEVFV